MRWLGIVTAALVIIASACTDDTTDTQPPGTGGQAGGGAHGGTGGGGGEGATGGGGSGGGGGCLDSLAAVETPPETLSATGLYSDIATKELAPYVHEFAPQFVLWSDGAVKKRWVYLPECNGVIDNTDDDIWSFPVGTRMWKQFERDGKLIETRLIHRWGAGDDDFFLVTYRWDDQDMEANHLVAGEIDAKGTEHDIPAEDQCTRCHGNGLGPGGTPARYLGFSAIQLSHGASAVNMETLSDEGHLEVPNPTGYTVPGNATEQAALGYLHANCANCHNETPDGLLFPYIPMRLLTSDMQVMDTAAYNNLVDQDVSSNFLGSCDAANGGAGLCPCNKYLDGGDLTNSCVHYRMSQRNTDLLPSPMQMPPLATAEADTTGGMAAIAAWVAILP